MKIIFIIVVTLFLFCLMMYVAFYTLLKEQFDICQIATGKTLYNVYVNIDRLDVTEM